MESERDQVTGQAQKVFEAIKTIAVTFDRGPRDLLSQVRELVDGHFLEVRQPWGRRDNDVEQRLVGIMLAVHTMDYYHRGRHRMVM